MKPIILIFISVFFLLTSCDKETTTQEVDQRKLEAMYTELQQLSQSVACTNAEEWSFTGIGSKACGGATTYIAYSSKIDTASFLSKAEKYTSAMADYNKKWNIFSDCALILRPDEIVCEDGKPKLVYNDHFLD